MSEVWVADAAPLILLAKAGHLALLTHLADEVLLPMAVIREIRKGPADDPARLALDAGFGTSVPTVRAPAAIRALGLLGAGEKAVIALAYRRGDCRVVMDDKKGRDGADRLGIPKIGTLGVIVLAHRNGHVARVVPILHDLLAAGLYVTEAMLQGIAASAGETWP